jgi:segregation and condensation protein A
MGVDGVSLDHVVGPVVYGQHVSELQPPAPDDPGVLASDAVPDSDAGLPADAEVDSGKFTVRLHNFTGPFDLLLQLIGKHKMDVTEVALHQVTDDFIAYIRAMGDDWDLDETSEFLLVAATLLDLKAARLLPAAEVEDEEDLALLEARDLLFSRLLQYKAFKEAAAHLAELESQGARRWPRAVTMEPRYAEALPDLVLGVVPQRLFKLALKQFMPKPGPPQVSIAHIHQVRVSVREHANLIRDRLRRAGSATFSLLIADCDSTLEVVARFLALLELYREGLIEFEQPLSLDELTVRWVGGENAEGDLEIDDYEGSPPPPDTEASDVDPDPLPPLDDDTDPDDLDDLDLDDVDLGGSAGLNARVEAALSGGFDDVASPRDAEPDRGAEPNDDAELDDAELDGAELDGAALDGGAELDPEAELDLDGGSGDGAGPGGDAALDPDGGSGDGAGLGRDAEVSAMEERQ